MSGDNNGSSVTIDDPVAEQHERFAKSLSKKHKMLVTLRDELAEYRAKGAARGSWELMSKDLHTRLKGRPYIFKLVNRIEEDLNRIEELQMYEQKHNINLADYLPNDN